MGDSIPNSYWKDLMLVAQTASSSENERTEPKPLDDNDKKFIEAAMADLVQNTDPVEQIKKHLASLRAVTLFGNKECEIVENLVESLEDFVCQIDAAFDFCLLGGLSDIQRFLDSDCDRIRKQMLRLVLTIAQNNPKVQDAILKTNLLQNMMSIIISNKEETVIRVKALSAVSSVVRAHADAYSLFRQLNGFTVLSEIFHSAISINDNSLARKAAFVMTSLCFDMGHSEARNLGLVPLIIRMFSNLPVTDEAMDYLREYLKEELSNVNLDSESKDIIVEALKRQRDHELTSDKKDEMWSEKFDSCCK